jgi:spermidine synthase
MKLVYTEVDREETSAGLLVLRRYDADAGEHGYEILLDGAFLMASHGCHSERAMAELARSRLPTASTHLTALVGGLGAGHTLRAALDLPGIHRVVVAEIGAKVVLWNRRYFAEFNGGAVDDPRVEVVVSDVLRVIAGTTEPFDLILLDVDNGPGWLATATNERLYGVRGLELCRRALEPGGVLAVWSPQTNASLEEALTDVFGAWNAADTTALAREAGEPPSVIYLASRALAKN